MFALFVTKSLTFFKKLFENIKTMANSTTKANEIIKLIEGGQTVDSVKTTVSKTPSEWYNYSSKAYNVSLEKGKKERKNIESKPHVSATTNNEVQEIINLNEKLSDFALLLPIFSTMGDLIGLKDLVKNLPASESEIIIQIGKVTMHPRLRVMQKQGRFEIYEHFKIFSKLIDAAVLSFYRTNFISCYLTLLPVIEGIIIRWMGYTESGVKPEFEDIRKFFKNSAQRQPCPHNILFHNIYTKACDKILNNHFYKPTTTSGVSYANFNRHVASHLLNNDQFGTKENCIRLFILIDAMTEIFLYESRINDPRFNLRNEDMAKDIEAFSSVIVENTNNTPEHIILGTSFSDLII